MGLPNVASNYYFPYSPADAGENLYYSYDLN
jgi:hypothetical protein